MNLHGKRRSGLAIWVSALVVTAASFAARDASGGAGAEAILRKVGTAKGICVVLGLPKAGEAEFVAQLASGNELLIYFQSPEADEVAEVRKSAEVAGLLGRRVFVDRGDWRTIHLADNLAGAVVVAPAAEKSVGRAELLRVLHPNGKAILARSEIVKPFPAGSDDWRYPYHAPDNNPQSGDQIARAPYLTQFLADPKFCPSPAVTVSAGGRVFRALGHQAHQANQNAMLNTLLCINAYNGTILWKRPLRDGFMILRNTIIATPETLYLADDESCKLLDAATGELRGAIVSPDPATDGRVWKWMALEGGVLYALVGGEEFKAEVIRTDGTAIGGWPRANWPGYDYPDAKTAWAQGRTLLAIDTKTRKLLWRHREQEFVDGRAVCMKNGRIYFLSPERFLACIEAGTGKVVWKTSDADLLKAIGPMFPQQPRWTGLSPFPYVRCNDKFLFFSGPRMPRIVTVSTRDGRLVWQKEVRLIDGGSVHLLLRPDALYAVGEVGTDGGMSLDYDTGEVRSRFFGRRGCTMITGSADSIFYRAPEGTVRVDLATGTAEHIAPMRPPCYEGVIVSGGLLQWGAWKCRCQLSLYGNVCLAPMAQPRMLSGLQTSAIRKLEACATLEAQPFPVHPDDWPAYQANNSRTAATQVAIPKQVTRAWVSEPSSPCLPTAPVAAGSMVFVGDDRGIVRALDAADGKLKWKAYTGASIHFPPAVSEGRVFVGSADGHVYAFEAATGRLLWRFRAAPAERWIPVFGKLSSTWPVAGGVVVENGVVYAAAGIAHYDGTHVVALDAVTGKPRWQNATSGQLSDKTHSGISLQGDLYLADGQLCFAGGNVYPEARYNLKTGQCMNPAEDNVKAHANTAFYPYYPDYGQYAALNHTLSDGRSLNYAADFNDYRRGAAHSTLALFGPLPPGAAPLPPNWRVLPRFAAPKSRPPVLWEHKPGPQYHGFIVASDTLLAAGQVLTESKRSCFLSAVNVADGSEVWREELPAPPVKAGAAMDHQSRIFVSLQDGRILSWRKR
ncbi:MAG: PQQ-binding-like beta-propeller repeat protein [Verrucomicrobia bacterium]|nr:PQQ-binding-like beta-propeller repeat protein [Verrucomicrobiota bacterium]